MALTFEQLSIRQELLSKAYTEYPIEFHWIQGELERLADKLPKSKKSEYFKLVDSSREPKGKVNYSFYEESWN